MSKEIEIWRGIIYKGVDYTSHYKISTQGRVIGFKGRYLNPAKTGQGYYYVCLCKDKNIVSAKVHRLVAEAFVPLVTGKEQINHIDGDKLNNWANNLEWCTHKENMKHRDIMGLTPRGEKHGRSKLTEINIEDIRASTLSRKEIAVKYGMSYSHISAIINRTKWNWKPAHK